MLILIINIFLVYLLYFDSSLIDESVYRYSIAEYYMKNLFNKHSYNLEKNCSDLYNKYRDLDDE